LVALAIYAAAGRGRGVRVALWTAALAGSVLMGITRVYLGVHWPTDVMAGVILGIAWATTCARSLRIDAIPRPASRSITARRAQLAVTFSLAIVAFALTPI
jgi:membrane-associated phospholipid phosphatase